MDLIGRFFPRWALRRRIDRIQYEQFKKSTRAYEGGVINSLHPMPVGSNSSANTNMEIAGEKMRMRARHFDENHDIVTGLFDTLVLNIVGNSNPIRPMVKNVDGSLNKQVNDTLTDYWNEWCLQPTLCHQYTMMKALKLAARAWLRDGEYLTRFARGTAAKSNVLPLSLELIEADYLPYRSDEKNKNIVQGVEFNSYNQVTNYHLYKQHPENDLFNIATLETKRVKAADILHLKYFKRTHQVRGVTLLHSVLTRLDDLKDYEESERIAARVAAAMTSFIQKGGDQLGGTSATGERQLEMSPGMIFDGLQPGETINTIASNRPNPELINFRQSMLRAVAAGTRTNCSTISRDYSGTYSSQRQELLESKPGYESLRVDFTDDYLAPIWREFVNMLMVSGKLKIERNSIQSIYAFMLRAIDIGWIDPKKQADAVTASIGSRITSRGKVIRDSGGDPEEVFAEIDEEEKRFGAPDLTINENEEVEENAEENEQD